VNRLLREVFRTARAARLFEMGAMVVFPEHLHALSRLPEGGADYSRRWRAIKGLFSRVLATAGVPLRQDRRGEYDL
jgi:putative transposase